MGASPATSHDVLLTSSHHSHHDSYSSPHQTLTKLRISCIHDNDTDTETDERDSSVRMSSNSSISSYIYESPDTSPRSSRSIQQDEISPHSRARHVMSPTSMSSSYCMTPGSSTPSSRRPSDGQDTHPSPSTSVSTLVSSTSACSLSSLRHTYTCENPDCGGHCASTSGGACTCECACTCICTSCLFPALHPRYVVQATLQESLFGSVKLAYDTHIQSHVAIKMSERQLLEDNLTLAGHTVIEDVEKEVSVMSLLQATSTLKHATPLHSQRTLFTFAQQTLLGTYPEDEEEQQEEKKTRTSNIPQASPHPTLARSLLPQSLRSRRNSITSQPKASFASLLSVGVKHVVPLVDVIIDNDYHYLVTPYYDQSDLYEYISERSTKQTEVTPLVNKEAHSMFKQLISAVAYMHSRGIVHRDLSLENILLSTTPNKSDVPTLHVIDFGVAAIHPTITNPTLPDNPPFHTFPMVPGTHRPGKLLYMCPELFNYQTYDAYSNDLFSCGVILYCMLLGRPPFVSCEDEWAQYIMSGQWLQHILTYQRHYGTESQWIYDPHWSDIYEHIDVEALDLLQCLLCPQERRYNIHQIIASPWFNKYT